MSNRNDDHSRGMFRMSPSLLKPFTRGQAGKGAALVAESGRSDESDMSDWSDEIIGAWETVWTTGKASPFFDPHERAAASHYGDRKLPVSRLARIRLRAPGAV